MAGAESNLAIGVRRLGRSAAWISRVGDDEFGRLVVGTLAAEGVDTSRVTVDATAPTGLMVKERRSDAITRVQYYRSGSAASRLSPSDVDEDLVRGARGTAHHRHHPGALGLRTGSGVRRSDRRTPRGRTGLAGLQLPVQACGTPKRPVRSCAS